MMGGGGLASTIMQGMAFGTGSAIAHRAIGGIANSMGGGAEGASAGAESGAAAVHTGAGAGAAAEGPACGGQQIDFFNCLEKVCGWLMGVCARACGDTCWP